MKAYNKVSQEETQTVGNRGSFWKCKSRDHSQVKVDKFTYKLY